MANEWHLNGKVLVACNCDCVSDELQRCRPPANARADGHGTSRKARSAEST